MIDVMKYMRRSYSQRAHPCLSLVMDVLQEDFGLKRPTEDRVYTLSEKNALVIVELSQRTRTIPSEEVRAGDIVLMDVGGYHVGIALSPRAMLHVPNDVQGVVYEQLDSIYIRNRIISYHRLKEGECKQTS